MPKKIKLLVACCSSLSRIGLLEVLSEEKDLKVVNETCEEDIIHDVRKTKPDVLLLCCNFLLERGYNLISKIKENIEGIKIVAFNCDLTLDQEIKLFKGGVAGILSSNCDPKALIKALRKVYSGEFWFRRELMNSIMGSHSSPEKIINSGDEHLELTRRELDILTLIAGGYKNREISSKLCVAEGTVKVHINNIYKKLDIKDRMQATFYALKHELISSKK